MRTSSGGVDGRGGASAVPAAAGSSGAGGGGCGAGPLDGGVRGGPSAGAAIATSCAAACKSLQPLTVAESVGELSMRQEKRDSLQQPLG